RTKHALVDLVLAVRGQDAHDLRTLGADAVEAVQQLRDPGRIAGFADDVDVLEEDARRAVELRGPQRRVQVVTRLDEEERPAVLDAALSGQERRQALAGAVRPFEQDGTPQARAQ